MEEETRSVDWQTRDVHGVEHEDTGEDDVLVEIEIEESVEDESFTDDEAVSEPDNYKEDDDDDISIIVDDGEYKPLRRLHKRHCVNFIERTYSGQSLKSEPDEHIP